MMFAGGSNWDIEDIVVAASDARRRIFRMSPYPPLLEHARDGAAAGGFGAVTRCATVDSGCLRLRRLCDCLAGPLAGRRAAGGGFVVAAELPDRFEEFGVGGVPQAAAVEIGAQFAHGRDELGTAHLGQQFGEFPE